ncbi:hypothetical protein GCM10009599_16140 [Luteococcus peritonei]
MLPARQKGDQYQVRHGGTRPLDVAGTLANMPQEIRDKAREHGPSRDYEVTGEEGEPVPQSRVDRRLEEMREEYAQHAQMAVGERDARGYGWDMLVAIAALKIGGLTLTPTTKDGQEFEPYSEEEAREIFEDVVPQEMRDAVPDKWLAKLPHAVAWEFTDPLTGYGKRVDVEALADGKKRPQDEQEDQDWLAQLARNDKGFLERTTGNLASVMEHDDVVQHLATNTMGGFLSWRHLPPWRSSSSAAGLSPEVTDADLVRVQDKLKGYFGPGTRALTKEECTDAVVRRAGDNSYSPWRDHLDALPAWDGVERIPTCIDSVADTPYSRQVLLNFFLAMMDRAYRPGCQVDSMLVLWGVPGVRKSSWFRALAPDGMLAELDAVPDTGQQKDALARAHRAAIVMLDEMDRITRKADVAALKAFLTGREDTWRAPYGRMDHRHLRQFVVAGTTNDAQFLMETDGARRYWPLEVTAPISPDRLTRDFMDLLLAEARDRYRRGERMDYSSSFEAQADQVRLVNMFDPVGDAIDRWLADADEEETGRLAPAILVREVPELRDVNLVRDKATQTKITNAMNRRNDYRRLGAPAKIGNVKHKTVWERVD